MTTRCFKWIVAAIGVAVLTGCATALKNTRAAPPLPPVAAEPAPVSESGAVSQVLIILERPPNWSGQAPHVHYYIFISKSGDVAIATPEDLRNDSALHDAFMRLKLMGHYEIVPVTPTTHAPETCT